MLNIKLHTIAWIILSIFFLTGCSPKPEEVLLEKYYRASVERDAQALKNMTDFRMFDSRSGMSMGLAQQKAQMLYSEIDALYDKYGELEKVVIKKSEKVNDGDFEVLLVQAELVFKKGGKAIRREVLTQHSSAWKILMFNEWARTEQDKFLFGY